MDGPICMIYADGLFKLDPFVFDMHTKNGLLVDCARSSLTLAQIEDDLLDIVPEVEDKEERPILAGSTIHFDLGFVRAHWPRLAARLSHRCYDVSAIKLVAPSVLQRVADEAIQMFGGAGVSNDTPLTALFAMARVLRIADGPDEVHRAVIAKAELTKQRRA